MVVGVAVNRQLGPMLELQEFSFIFVLIALHFDGLVEILSVTDR
jgi:hypothetical protein